MERSFVAAVAAIALLMTPEVSGAQAPTKFGVHVLSSPRPNLVTGGDALIEVSGAGSEPVELKINGVEAHVLRPDSDRGSSVGLVTGLRDGPNLIVARSARRSSKLCVVNFPKTILSSSDRICSPMSAGPKKPEWGRQPTRIAMLPHE